MPTIIKITTGTGSATYTVSTGARGPVGPTATVTAAAVVAALGAPSYATLTAANAALSIGKIFWNTTAEELQVTTA